MEPEVLTDVQAELAAAGLPADEVAAIRIVQSGKHAGLPYMTVANEAVAELWSRLRGICFSRRYPVVVDQAEDVFQRPGEATESIAGVVAEGRYLETTSQWPALLIADLNRRWAPYNELPPLSEMTELPGLWPIASVGLNHFVGWRRSHAPSRPNAHLLLPACPEPWMAPAYLKAQRHNYLPTAAMQCAVFRSWYLRFGAEVVYMNGSVYEFAVGQPPTDRDAAMELACEQYVFCPDRLDGASGATLRQFAAVLMKSSVWYFWWD